MRIAADKLLPLSADVEVSDYPTLDEVEQMAAEASHLSDSRKPNSLLVVSNVDSMDGKDEVCSALDTAEEVIIKIIMNLS